MWKGLCAVVYCAVKWRQSDEEERNSEVENTGLNHPTQGKQMKPLYILARVRSLDKIRGIGLAILASQPLVSIANNGDFLPSPNCMANVSAILITKSKIPDFIRLSYNTQTGVFRDINSNDAGKLEQEAAFVRSDILPAINRAAEFMNSNCTRKYTKWFTGTFFLYSSMPAKPLPNDYTAARIQFQADPNSLFMVEGNGIQGNIQNYYSPRATAKKIQSEKNAAEKRLTDERSAFETQFKAFQRKYHVKDSDMEPLGLDSNPFAYEGVTVMLLARFNHMEDASTGVFNHGDRNSRIIVTAIPRGIFLNQNQPGFIVASVLGNAKLSGEMLPRVKYLGALVCKDRKCVEQ